MRGTLRASLCILSAATVGLAIPRTVAYATIARQRAAVATGTLTVNSVGDSGDATPGDGVCAIAAGSKVCTLRAAIQEALADGAVGTIAFAIGSGPVTISPTSPLPVIDRSFLIDGGTQPGYAGLPIVTLNGTSAGAGAAGLTGLVVAHALVINRFSGPGISLTFGGRITGSFIGTDVTGTSDLGNGGPGISISGEDALIGGPTVGGPLVGTGNLISGNNGGGIAIGGSGTNPPFTGSLIEGNLVGTSLSGQTKLANTGAGITVGSDSGGDRIGVAGSGNVIAGNTGDGVLFNGTTLESGNWDADGNFIGTDPTGTDNLGNGGAGVDIGANLEGALAIGQNAKNTIAFNAGAGIKVMGGLFSEYAGNSIYSNGGIGIDINGDGVTPNDAKDADAGPDRQQNFPVLSNPVFSNNILTMTVNLNSTPSHTFRINYYSNTSCDGGEGKVFFSSDVATKTTNTNGDITAFAESISGLDTTPGHFITATATDITSTSTTTSEYSACLAVPWAHTFTVNSALDTSDTNPGDGICSAPAGQGTGCTLRAAIQEANATVGDDHIVFGIGTGAHSILPSAPLDAITERATIDATTQPGFAGNPIIELDGANAGAGADGFDVNTEFATIRGFVINRFSNDGIRVDGQFGTGDAHIEGNYIGTDATGQLDLGNGASGVELRSNGTVVGGATLAARNVLSGNGAFGVSVTPGPDTPDFESSNIVENDFIGLNALSAPNLGNTLAGVNVNGGSQTVIGGPATALSNAIDANHANGVQVVSSTHTTIARNTLLVNTGSGVSVTNASNNTVIGGATLGVLNTIAGSTDAISLVGATVTATTIQGDLLGSVTGSAPTANAGNGIYISNASNTAVGGVLPVARNVISLNAQHGILATGSNATGLVVTGSFIGTDASGTVAKGNGVDGVYLQAPGAVIGGTPVGARNVISGNVHAGIVAAGTGASGTTILGNSIGIGADGTTSVGNGDDGIGVAGAPGTVIGGIVAGDGNVISANQGDGVQIGGRAATGAIVQKNLIGTDLTGAAARGNGIAGVRIVGAPGNTIGGNQPGNGNTIVANATDGVLVTGATATGNTVAGNFIGVTLASGVPVVSGNGGDGVDLAGGSANTIGGQIGQGGNVIAGNGSNGVLVGSAGSSIAGNFIGTDGSIDLGNGEDGVFAQAGVTIGGTPSSGNVISGNARDGIEVAADGVDVAGNFVGLDHTGSVAIPNSVNGVQVDSGAGVLIGGDQADDQNVIGGNTGAGVLVAGDGVQIAGNIIGQSGSLGRGNHASGVVLNGASHTTVGGVKDDTNNPANVIASNGVDGVLVVNGSNNAIEGNSIVNNGQLGIDLGADGVTANDAKDVDTGANGLQNFPTFSSAVVGGGFLTTTGSLNSKPTTVFTLDLYSSVICDASGNGEGATLIAHTTLAPTDASGTVNFTLDLPTSVPPSGVLTAVATAPSGSTSEFSPCQPISEAIADMAVAVTDSPDPVVHGQNVTYTVAASNLGPSVAHAVGLTQTLGKKLTFVSATTTAGNCDQAGTRVTCDLGVMSSGATATITIVAMTSVAQTLTNSATIGSATTDPVSSNNTATVSTQVT
jgi:CSLREA domain-containing protein